MKKKLLFVIPEYNIGGTNKSLENLLALLDKDKYNISVYCLYEDGPDYYKKVFLPYIIKKSSLYYWLHDNVLTRKIIGLYNKITKNNNFKFLYKREAEWLQRKYKFDVVIAYQEFRATEFVSYIQDSKKIAWIHCDYPVLVGNSRYSEDYDYYTQYDKIVCVSKYAADSFRKFYRFPEHLVTFMYNTLNVSFIKQMSEESYDCFDPNKFCILSVGRLSKEKQFDKIPAIIDQLGEIKEKIIWYIIGSGSQEDIIRVESLKLGVSNQIVLMGAKFNPYPYMKHADLLVCTSSSESFSYVIAEAKILHTPILTNNFPVAYEVLEEDYGWISPIENMPTTLKKIIANSNNEYGVKLDNIKSFQFSNKDIIQKFESFI